MSTTAATAATVAIKSLLPQENVAWQSTTDEIRVLLHQESDPSYACGRNNLLSTYNKANEADTTGCIDENVRCRICEWSFKVVDEFGFDREVVSIAMNYIDRYVAYATESDILLSPLAFQLVAVTALYLAIKLHGEINPAIGPRRKLKIVTFVKVNGGCFSVEAIEKMERNLLSFLNWKMNPPTILSFVATMLRLLPKWLACDHRVPMEQVTSHIFSLARHLTELSVGWSIFTFKLKPSVIAYACILSAIDVGTRHSCPLPPDIQAEFLLRIAEATSLVVSRLDVREARWMLFYHFPSMFDLPPHEETDAPICCRSKTQSAYQFSTHNEMSRTERCGKTSPVCVCQDPREECPHRKRIRML
jgi:lipoyl(octanoyl) transferase